jgi:ankyrin repeat protein
MNKTLSLSYIHKTLMVMSLLIVHHNASCSENRHPQPDKISGELLGITPLHCAQSVEEINDYLSFAADINASDIQGFTPLDYAIALDKKALVRHLSKNGAKMSGKNMHQLRTFLSYPTK